MKTHLLTGGNLGNRVENLAFARHGIAEKIGQLTRQSSIYETSAWGITDQPAFLNQVLEVETDLAPLDMLAINQQIEAQAGRTRHQKWHARTLDIDILFVENQIITLENLTVPHPHLQNRNFALIPLVELIPDFEHPILEVSIRELLNRCSDELEVISLFQDDFFRK